MSGAIVRLLTCGSVDDGKSTLIGRLLVETDSIPHDTVGAARKVRRTGSTIPAGEIDFSLLTDGLEAEREQGITIDVAYRSMNLLDGKRLIISDAPGHEQYTRNMVVAASRADIALVLVDGIKGVRTQTLRHLTICSLMGVSRVIVAINKLDAVGFDKKVFDDISAEIQKTIDRLELTDVHIIPLSALAGDNVVFRSENMNWYSGKTLIESIQDWSEPVDHEARGLMRIQMIARAENFRGVSGTVRRGSFSKGDDVTIFPSMQKAKISSIVTFNEESAHTPTDSAVTLVLTPEVDATRGDIIAQSTEDLIPSDRLAAHIVWLNEEPLIHSRSYLLVSGATTTPAIVTKIRHKIDVNTGEHISSDVLQMNEIGDVEVATDIPVVMRPYTDSREFGNFILVDRLTLKTVGAGMVRHSLRRASNVTHQDYEITKAQRGVQKSQKARVIWLTGLSGSGKSTIANALEQRLFASGAHAYVLDGDNLRLGLNMDLGFTPEDRAENVRRVSEVAKLMVDAGLIVITALVSPFEVDRQRAKSIFDDGEFLEVFVDTPVETCRSRDPKGLYKKSAAGQIPNFTGVGQDYERPLAPDLHLDGTESVADNVEKIIKILL
ncbi:adenylyl-sulfate kinase [Candidatus Planktophila versatilis]|uniref:adenylyl-sulfate kinase n=1 Tax=Candidatus Planktophila versatilis TaxID=1884905 RepID=UPI003CF294D5